MHYPPIPQRKSCNCEDPCISTDDVYYAGPNLPNSGVNTNDILTEVIEKLDAIYAVPTLQRVTEINNYTTLPIFADSFVKIGGDGTNLLLDNGTVLPIDDLPAGVTETSQLINDGEDGINPFITALDIPAFNPSDYDLDEFTNNNIDPFAKISDIPEFVNHWTKTGNIIRNNNTGNIEFFSSSNYIAPNGDAYLRNISGAVVSATGGVILPNNGRVSCDGDGTNYIQGVRDSHWISDIKFKYATDLSSTYDDRTLVDKGYVDSKRPYKVYSALLTQTGVTAPTAIVLENTLGGTVTFTYVSPGIYTINSSSLFTVDKTSVIAGNLGLYITGYLATNTTTTINLFTSASGVYADEGLAKTFLEIRVYN